MLLIYVRLLYGARFPQVTESLITYNYLKNILNREKISEKTIHGKNI